MKVYKLYLIYALLIISYTGYAKVSSVRSGKPTIKVGVLYTTAARASFSENNSIAFDQAVTDQTNRLLEVFNTNFQNTYEISFTGLKEIKEYQEPKYRERKPGDIGYDEYSTYPFQGTNQVVDEILYHRQLKDLLITTDNGSYDETINRDIIDLDELDEQYLVYAEESIPDVIIVIADESGPIVSFDNGLKAYSGTGFEKILYGVMPVNALTFDRALSVTFFSLFCNSENASITYDEEKEPTASSLMGYWELIDLEPINSGLTSSNVTEFSAHAAKLQLASQTSNSIDRDIDFTGAEMTFDAVDYTMIEPNQEGNTTTVIYDESEPSAKGTVIICAGEYSSGTTHQNRSGQNKMPPPPPPAPKHTAIRDFSVAPFSLPISFDGNAKTLANYAVRDYYNNTTAIVDIDGMTVAKTIKESGAWMESYTEIANESKINDLKFSVGKSRLTMRIKAPAANIKVRLELYDENNHFRVMADAQTSTANEWEKLTFDFSNHTGSIPLQNNTNYDRIRIYFDFDNAGTGKAFYWDDINFPSYPLELPILFDQPIAFYEIDDDSQIQTAIFDLDNKSTASTTITGNPVGTYNLKLASASGLKLPFTKQDSAIRIEVRAPERNRRITIKLTATDGSVATVTKKNKLKGQLESRQFDFEWNELKDKEFNQMEISFEFKNANEVFYWTNVHIPMLDPSKKRSAIGDNFDRNVRQRIDPLAAIASRNVFNRSEQAYTIESETEDISEDFYDLVDFGKVSTSLKTIEGNQLVESIVSEGYSGQDLKYHRPDADGVEISSALGFERIQFSDDTWFNTSPERRISALISKRDGNSNFTGSYNVFMKLWDDHTQQFVIAKGVRGEVSPVNPQMYEYTFDFNSPLENVQNKNANESDFVGANAFDKDAIYDQLFLYFSHTGTYWWDNIEFTKGTDVKFSRFEMTPDEPCVGDLVSFDIRIKIEGGDASNVKVKLELDNAFVSPSFTPTKGVITAGNVWEIGDMSQYDEERLTINAGAVLAYKRYVNKFEINSDFDKNKRNNLESTGFLTNPAVFLMGVYETKPIPSTGNTYLEIEFKNYGKCPAINTKLLAEIDSDVFTHPNLANSIITNPATLNKGTVINLEDISGNTSLFLNRHEWIIPKIDAHDPFDDNDKLTRFLNFRYTGSNKNLKYKYKISNLTNIAPRGKGNAQYWVIDPDGVLPTRPENQNAELPEQTITKSLTIYPNPFTDLFKIVYEQENGSAADVVIARVYDLSGRVVLEQQYSVGNSTSKELEIDGSQLSNGNYIIELNDGSGNLKRGKLIKK